VWLALSQGHSPIISATWREKWRYEDLGSMPSLSKRISKTLSQETKEAWWYMSVIPAMWEVEVGGQVHSQP
jgi:hypothetical protein